MSKVSDQELWGEAAQDTLAAEIAAMSTQQIKSTTRMLDTNIRVMNSEVSRVNHDIKVWKTKVKENQEKIKLNKQLPYLVSNIVEVLDLNDLEEEPEEGAAKDAAMSTQGKGVVVKTSTRQSVFLPVVGLVDPNEVKPGDLVGVHKDSYLVLEKLPSEFDSRVKAMEIDEKPTEDYSDVGGLDKQIEELIEAVVLPITHKERFKNLGIKPPKGVLMFGPPGTGKTVSSFLE
jgi:26S proteasome regulatory subunit T5